MPLFTQLLPVECKPFLYRLTALLLQTSAVLYANDTQYVQVWPVIGLIDLSSSYYLATAACVLSADCSHFSNSRTCKLQTI